MNTELTIETQAFLEGLQKLNLPSIKKSSVNDLREQYELAAMLYAGDPIQEFSFQDIPVFLSDLEYSVTIRHYSHDNPKHYILYAHGGGCTRGSLTTHHAMCQNLAYSTHCDVIAINYSLSPENPYPVALDEVERIYLWLYNQIQQNYIKNLPITVAGDSAGANIMGGMIVRLNQKNLSIPQRAVFFYPSFDLTRKLPSIKEFSQGYLLTEEAIEYYISNYLGGNFNLAENLDASPLWAMEKMTFPKTLLIAAGADPIRDDARLACDVLQKKGELMGYLEVPGVLHGFAQFSCIFPEAKQTFDWISKNYY